MTFSNFLNILLIMEKKENTCVFFWQNVDRCLRQRDELLQNLAESTGIKYQTITSWRTNNRLPDLYSALLIASYLDVTVEYLAIPRSTNTVINNAFNALFMDAVTGDSKKVRELLSAVSKDVEETSKLVEQLEMISNKDGRDA